MSIVHNGGGISNSNSKVLPKRLENFPVTLIESSGYVIRQRGSNVELVVSSLTILAPLSKYWVRLTRRQETKQLGLFSPRVFPARTSLTGINGLGRRYQSVGHHSSTSRRWRSLHLFLRRSLVEPISIHSQTACVFVSRDLIIIHVFGV